MYELAMFKTHYKNERRLLIHNLKYTEIFKTNSIVEHRNMRM
jgi:hypothetical protein